MLSNSDMQGTVSSLAQEASTGDGGVLPRRQFKDDAVPKWLINKKHEALEAKFPVASINGMSA